jgi:hypothetical protein
MTTQDGVEDIYGDSHTKGEDDGSQHCYTRETHAT